MGDEDERSPSELQSAERGSVMRDNRELRKVIGLFDSTGTEVVRYMYDSWGKVLSVTGSMASTLGALNPIRYRGYYYDVETGLYYLRSRYYKPEWMRFINTDSIINDNLYKYCRNNPIILSDQNGMQPDEKKSIGEWIEAAFAIIDSLYEYEKNLYYSSTVTTVVYVLYSAELASEYTKTYFAKYNGISPEDLDGTAANAFRHACWNAFMTYYLDEKIAEEFANAHEYQSQYVVPEQPYLGYTEKIHSDMDLYFNQLGRNVALDLGFDVNEDEIAAYVLKAVYHDMGHVLIRNYGNTLTTKGMRALRK